MPTVNGKFLVRCVLLAKTDNLEMGLRRPARGQCMSSGASVQMTRRRGEKTCVDLPIFESLLQVVVDGLVGYLADESKI